MGNNDKSSVVMRLRIPTHLYNWLKKKANEEMRPLSMQVALYINKAFEEDVKAKNKKLSKEEKASKELNRTSSDEKKIGEGTMYNKYEEKEKKIQRGDG